ncbi:MAG: preprotein translocase subunit YajC [Clostridia bacterium]|nr:preprotein translocase subunit YajC [Clostridia bacterium]
MQPGQSQNLLVTLLPFAVLMVVFYFMLIRPQQTQKKKRETMLSGLRKGNRVVTIGGIHGEIVEIKDDALIVNVADQGERIIMRFSKWAVQDTVGKENQQSS